ncbi:hypothetical protein KR084_006503 [Drosophila pseudotakahashii]|nr:hypothetical protein KR084_006503 [Drosophila pseudotakahashii]
MKCAIAVCLLLATSGFALVPHHPLDVASMLLRQQFAVRSMMAVPEARDESTLINDCFNHYMEDQSNVIMGYNQQYTGCQRTAQADREELTNESASERSSLLERTNNMCTSLVSCENIADGLEFFDCYRSASSDSYKVMFTLNSDSSLDFNRISAKYAVIDSDLTDCMDTARAAYAHDMDTCDADLTICLNGGVAPTVPTDPTTTPAAPTTTTTPEAPTTPAAPTTTPAAPTTTTTPEAPTTPAAPTTTPAAPTTTPAVPTTTPAVPTTTPAVPTTTPAEPTTTPAAPTTTVAPEITERPPEEDLFRSGPLSQKGAWNLIKRFF